MPGKIRLRPLHAAQHRGVFTQLSGCAYRHNLTEAVPVPQLIARCGAEAFRGHPRKAARSAFEAGARSSEVLAALEAEVERHGFHDRQTADQAEDGEAVEARDPVLDLVAVVRHSPPRVPKCELMLPRPI